MGKQSGQLDQIVENHHIHPEDGWSPSDRDWEMVRSA